MNAQSNKKVDYCLTLCTLSVILNLIVFFTVGLWWNSAGLKVDVNTLAVSITTIEIFLVIVALGGFWLLRRDVINTAKEEAEKVLKNCEDRAEEAAREVAERVAEGKDFGSDGSSDDGVAQQYVDAMGEDDD